MLARSGAAGAGVSSTPLTPLMISLMKRKGLATITAETFPADSPTDTVVSPCLIPSSSENPRVNFPISSPVFLRPRPILTPRDDAITTSVRESSHEQKRMAQMGRAEEEVVWRSAAGLVLLNAPEPTSSIKVSGFRQVHSAPTKGETFRRQKTANLNSSPTTSPLTRTRDAKRSRWARRSRLTRQMNIRFRQLPD